MQRFLAPLALCTFLGACNMYTSPGTGPTAFDGSYQGTMTTVHAATNACAAPGSTPGNLAVTNGAVVWKASASLTLYAPVMQDGAFVAQNGAVYLSGKITNRAMVARVNTGPCHVVYDLQRTV
jgi:hypothetical protein